MVAADNDEVYTFDSVVKGAAAAAAAAATAAVPWYWPENEALCANTATDYPAATQSTTWRGQRLDRAVSPVPAFDFDPAIAAQDSNTEVGRRMKEVLQVLKDFKVPGATIGVQLNPDAVQVPYSAPASCRRPQWWLMLGLGISHRAPMRVASVSKLLTMAVWVNQPQLQAQLNAKFWILWKAAVNYRVAEPRDARVKGVTIAHLLNHTSGFDIAKIGFDPAFEGLDIEPLVNQVLRYSTLLDAPGARTSYSNFGYMILARLAEAIIRRPFISLVRELFPGQSTAPIFEASDTAAVASNELGWGNPGADEPSTYYLQGKDDSFDVGPMSGNCDIATNVATLTWFATQYWLGGEHAGKKFSEQKPLAGFTWVMVGSMPGTTAVITQFITRRGRPASFCVIINTRPGKSRSLLDKLNLATVEYLSYVFR
ncbi:hypothetical protein OEZ86_004311 [Tetradesmus obliquus]|nr:hypothetical protein OEZ86_004311 [Tetradesmus obliquus]